MAKPVASEEKVKITVDFSTDMSLLAALRKFLTTDRELTAPGVLRNALRSYLADKGLYEEATHLADDEGNVTRIKK